MQAEVTQKLIEINRRFYQHFAAEFDRTRARLQPGVAGLLEGLVPAKTILDIGMGNGNLYRALLDAGFEGAYTGVDFSPALVQIARAFGDRQGRARFEVRDLAVSGWDADLGGPFDRILAFAVFHHLPVPIVRQVLDGCRRLLRKDGQMLISNWQFTNSERWRARVQPWERAGLDGTALDSNDYLLDWRSGGEGLRYVHLYSDAALRDLAGESDFRVLDSYHSDGHEGNLGLYQVWEPDHA